MARRGAASKSGSKGPAVGLSHLTARGDVHMVGVGEKAITARRAVASGLIKMGEEALRRLTADDVPKGNVLATARIAGIMAAKRTPDIVPLCHAIALTKVTVDITIDRARSAVVVTATTEAVDRTGVEMEALTAVSAACLTVYDMLKGIDRTMTITDVHLVEKRGGRSGTYRSEAR